MKRLLALALLAGCASAPPAEHAAHSAPGKPAAMDRNAMWKASLLRAPLAVTAAFDPQGRLWRARIDNGRLLVSRVHDNGEASSPPVAVNAEPEPIAADGENRPKLAFGKDGEIYVSWTQSGERPFSGHVRFARSLDGGRTFEAPLTVNDDRMPISHRFDSLVVTPDGRIHLVWLDKRDSATAQQRGEKYSGISLYYAVSTDRGASFGDGIEPRAAGRSGIPIRFAHSSSHKMSPASGFSANRKLADHSCECCRIALALDTDGTPVLAWRHVYGANTRDHALLRLDGQSQPVRVTHENWALDACPHHGPALGIGSDGVYHLAWYSGAEKQRGLFYAHSRDRGTTFTSPHAFGNPDAQAGHPQVLALGTRVSLAWKEFDGKQTVIRAQHSRDGGRTFAKTVTLAASASASDQPLLVSDGTRVLLSWNSATEGHRLVLLPENRP